MSDSEANSSIPIEVPDNLAQLIMTLHYAADLAYLSEEDVSAVLVACSRVSWEVREMVEFNYRAEP